VANLSLVKQGTSRNLRQRKFSVTKYARIGRVAIDIFNQFFGRLS
jgi:hypothetical protein